jgi:hypothetical protein
LLCLFGPKVLRHLEERGALDQRFVDTKASI